MLRKVLLGFLGLLLVGLAVLTVLGSEEQKITTEVDVAAPPEKVWAVLSNVAEWPKWSPIIKDAKGSAKLGEALEITMAGEGGAEGPRYKPTITELKAPNLLRWRAHMGSGFIFTNDKVLELKETSSGTKLIHTETFQGLMAPIICTQMEENVPPMLNKMNIALKSLVESSP